MKCVYALALTGALCFYFSAELFAILVHPLKEAFAKLEADYIAFWRATPAEDQLAREKTFIAINVLGKVQDHLNKVISDGTLAQAELNKLFADAERYAASTSSHTKAIERQT